MRHPWEGKCPFCDTSADGVAITIAKSAPVHLRRETVYKCGHFTAEEELDYLTSLGRTAKLDWHPDKLDYILVSVMRMLAPTTNKPNGVVFSNAFIKNRFNLDAAETCSLIYQLLNLGVINLHYDESIWGVCLSKRGKEFLLEICREMAKRATATTQT